MIDNFSTFAQYRTSIQKSIAFQYTTNKHTKKEVMVTIHSRILKLNMIPMNKLYQGDKSIGTENKNQAKYKEHIILWSAGLNNTAATQHLHLHLKNIREEKAQRLLRAKGSLL